jgi:hypothetical protein
MKKPGIFLSVLLCFFTGLFAQDLIREFEILPTKNKVHNSFYNKVDFLDSRGDSSRIGVVQVGLLKNMDAKFLLKTPFLQQLRGLVHGLIDSSAADREMLFQLKQFNFIEVIGTRYCYLGAALYAKGDSGYKKLSVLDTVIVITGTDVAKILMIIGNKIIADFVARGLRNLAWGNTIYSMSSLKNIDSVEKSEIPVYQATNYSDGIYTSYESFKIQVPDIKGLVDLKKDGTISSVKIMDTSGKKTKLKSKNLYAVIHKGHLFIATEYGYYPLQKINDNFFFTGDVKKAASSRDISVAQVGFGLLGAGLASMGSKARYDMIIDHLNGQFFHLREIKIDNEQN